MNAKMKKLLLAAVAALTVSAASAQTTQFYGANGTYEGHATTNSMGQTQFFGSNGMYEGHTQTNGFGQTQMFGSNGQYLGHFNQQGW
jgi:opacity protein-like surface antigen